MIYPVIQILYTFGIELGPHAFDCFGLELFITCEYWFSIFSILYLLDFGYFLQTAEEGHFVVPLFSNLIPCAYIFSRALFVKRCIRVDFGILFLM